MNKNKNKEIKKKQENIWNGECERLLAEWSEKASCYRWLHGRSEKSYQRWYYCFSIPVIILSTLTGAANVGMDSFVPQESKAMASAIVGGVNIFAGIVSTLQNFLKVAELMEGHRIAGVSWGKLQRNIAIELALDPSRRVLESDFLKLSRAEYDRLIEAGPMIDDGIIKQFNKKFKNYEVSVPSICNGLDKCNIYKIDKTIEMNHEEFEEGIEDVISREEETNKQNLTIKIDKNNFNDTESDEQDEPDELIKPIKPVKPVQPVEPIKPVEPAEPVEPVEPVELKKTNNKETNTDNISLTITEDEEIIPDKDSEKEDEDKKEEERLLSETSDFLNGIK